MVITREAIDRQILEEAAQHPACGAVLTFSGTVRNMQFGRKVTKLAYEAYEPMAHREIGLVIEAAYQAWPTVRLIQVLHRFGEMPVGASSIFITVSAPHRPEGFAALRFVIDRIKRDVPIWKKEYYADGESDWLHPEEGCCHDHLRIKPIGES